MVFVKPKNEVNAPINISNHRALPEEPDDREEFLIFIDVSWNGDFHLFARNFLASRAVLISLEDLQPSPLA